MNKFLSTISVMISLLLGISCQVKKSKQDTKFNFNELISDYNKSELLTFIPYNRAKVATLFDSDKRVVIRCSKGQLQFENLKIKNKYRSKVLKILSFCKKHEVLDIIAYKDYTILYLNYSDSSYIEVKKNNSAYMDDTKELYIRHCASEVLNSCPYKYCLIFYKSQKPKLGDFKNQTIYKLKDNVYYFRSFINAGEDKIAICDCK
jgi:hypothetical protein